MNTNKTNKKKDFKKNLDNIPEHLKNLVFLLKNNSEIRRFTALGLKNALIKERTITKEDKFYVNFYFSKFAVIVNGLKTEYLYNNQLFINCLVAAFPAFAEHALKTINNYCEIENSNYDYEKVSNISDELRNNNEVSPVEE